MDYSDVLKQIDEYAHFEPIDESYSLLFHSFIAQHKDASLSRKCLSGHVTASAVVVNESYDAMLLMHHKKLDIWLQFGGHVDDNPDIEAMARQELMEESGIAHAKRVSKNIFDLSIHEVSERSDEPEHLHFDIRFLYSVSSDVSFEVNRDEGYDIRWFNLDKIQELEKCWLDRVVRKVKAVHSKKYLV